MTPSPNRFVKPTDPPSASPLDALIEVGALCRSACGQIAVFVGYGRCCHYAAYGKKKAKILTIASASMPRGDEAALIGRRLMPDDYDVFCVRFKAMKDYLAQAAEKDASQ